MAFSVQLLCNILLCYVTAVPFFLQFHSADEEGSGDEGLALSRRENSWEPALSGGDRAAPSLPCLGFSAGRMPLWEEFLARAGAVWGGE